MENSRIIPIQKFEFQCPDTYIHVHVSYIIHTDNTYIHVLYIHTYIHIIHTNTYIHTCIIHTYIHTCIIHTYIHTYNTYNTYIHTYDVCTCTHTHTHTHTHLHTHVHTYSCTYILIYFNTGKRILEDAHEQLDNAGVSIVTGMHDPDVEEPPPLTPNAAALIQKTPLDMFTRGEKIAYDLRDHIFMTKCIYL